MFVREVFAKSSSDFSNTNFEASFERVLIEHVPKRDTRDSQLQLEQNCQDIAIIKSHGTDEKLESSASWRDVDDVFVWFQCEAQHRLVGKLLAIHQRNIELKTNSLNEDTTTRGGVTLCSTLVNSENTSILAKLIPVH